MDKTYLSYLLGAAEGIIPVIISIIAVSRNKIKERRWRLIQKMANVSMTYVENYALEHGQTLTSAQKLAMALSATEIDAKAAGIKWTDELKTQVSEYITEMCAWSKTVNSR